MRTSLDRLRASGPSGRATLGCLGCTGATSTPVSTERLLGEWVGTEPSAASPTVLVAAPSLGERARELLTARGVSFADATGNLRLVSERPGLFVERRGAVKDPWPDDQPLRSLRGRGA